MVAVTEVVTGLETECHGFKVHPKLIWEVQTGAAHGNGWGGGDDSLSSRGSSQKNV